MQQPDPLGGAAPPALRPSDLSLRLSGPASGPTVLVLHGWGSSSAYMEPIVQGLSDTFRVCAPDLPGHGLSPAPPGPWGVPEYARLVCELIDSFGGGPVPVIGHSNGGRIALYIASEEELKTRISRLALVSPSGMKPRRTWRFHARRAVAEVAKAPFRILPDPFRSRTLAWLRRSLLWKALGSSDYRAAEGVMRDVFVRTVTFFLDHRVSTIRVPTLVFRGDRDDAVSQDQVSRLVSSIPHAGFVPLHGGHYAYLDDPARFLAAVRHFLEPELRRIPDEASLRTPA